MGKLCGLLVELRNREWIESRLDALEAEFGGKYVAVFGQQVVASGATIQAVKNRVRTGSLFPDVDEESVTIAFVSSEPTGMLL